MIFFSTEISGLTSIHGDLIYGLIRGGGCLDY
jgi:hypothetical protein